MGKRRKTRTEQEFDALPAVDPGTLLMLNPLLARLAESAGKRT